METNGQTAKPCCASFPRPACIVDGITHVPQHYASDYNLGHMYTQKFGATLAVLRFLFLVDIPAANENEVEETACLRDCGVCVAVSVCDWGWLPPLGHNVPNWNV